MLVEHLEGHRAVRRDADLVSIPLQHLGEHGREVRLIIDDEYGLRTRRWKGRGCLRAGRRPRPDQDRELDREPAPAPGLAVERRSSRRAPRSMLRQSERPSPVPSPVGLVVKNGSKTLARSSGAMPGPVSVTSRRTRPRDASWCAVKEIQRGCGLSAHRLMGIRDEVHEDLVELMRVGRECRQIVRQIDGRPRRCPCEARRRGARRPPAPRRATARRSARAGAGARGRGSCGRCGHTAPRPAPICRRDGPRASGSFANKRSSWALPSDDRERIVELVRDAGEKRPHRRDLLALEEPARPVPDRLFERPLLRLERQVELASLEKVARCEAGPRPGRTASSRSPWRRPQARDAWPRGHVGREDENRQVVVGGNLRP